MSNARGISRIGWIGIGRMGYEMAARLAKGGARLTVWNRTRAKAEPLTQYGARIADRLADLAACDIVFVMVSTWDDVKEVLTGPAGLLSGTGKPQMIVECSSISLEGSAELRETLRSRGIELLAAPVSGNAKVIKAGRLSFVCSGPKPAFDAALPFLEMIAPSASYVGEGELARIVKICHNVLSRRGHAIARRDHGACREGRRAAPRVSRLHEPERDGLDVLSLQDAGVRQARLQGDVHAEAAAQGPGPGSRRRVVASRCRCRSHRSPAIRCRR